MGTAESASAGLSPSLKLSKPLSELTGEILEAEYRPGYLITRGSMQSSTLTPLLPEMQLMRCVQQHLLPSRHYRQEDQQCSL
jgi:hypothetical protein